jgi:hypothetical protein
MNSVWVAKQHMRHHGKDVLSIRTAQHWFKTGNFEPDDSSRPGRLLEIDTDVLKQLIEKDYAKRLVESKRDYSLVTSSNWLRHHC